jgi:hypothetical protein
MIFVVEWISGSSKQYFNQGLIWDMIQGFCQSTVIINDANFGGPSMVWS